MVYTQYPQLNLFLDYLLFQKRYSKHTIIAYKKDLEDFFLFLINEFDSADVTAYYFSNGSYMACKS